MKTYEIRDAQKAKYLASTGCYVLDVKKRNRKGQNRTVYIFEDNERLRKGLARWDVITGRALY